MLQMYYQPDSTKAAKVLARYLLTALPDQRVLWLVSGGSNIALSVQVMKRIPTKLQPNLAIMLTDERYDVYDHADSNLRQLYEGGLKSGKATVVPVLMPVNMSLTQTVKRYEQVIETAFANADVIVAQLGIGVDGHIAGILPKSAATRSKALVCGYKAMDYTRITLTMMALKQVSIAFAFAYGDRKEPALEQLSSKALALSTQPAQVLKQIPEARLYTDQHVTKQEA